MFAIVLIAEPKLNTEYPYQMKRIPIQKLRVDVEKEQREMMNGVYKEGYIKAVRDLARVLQSEIKQLDWFFNSSSTVDVKTANSWYKIREEIRRYEKD